MSRQYSEATIANTRYNLALKKAITDKWEGRTPPQLLQQGMYVCHYCRHINSIDNKHCTDCGTEKFIIRIKNKPPLDEDNKKLLATIIMQIKE